MRWRSCLRRRLATDLPAGLLGCLGLLLLVEGFVARHDDDFGNYEAIEWGRSGRSAEREAVHAPWLFFGDSQVKTRLIPAVIEATTGQSAMNLAVQAGQAPATYFLLRRALESGARPKAIVVDFKSFLLNTGPRQHLNRWPDLLRLRDRLELCWDARDAALFAHLGLARHLSSFRSRDQIRSAILQNVRGSRASLRFTNFQLRRNWNRNRGSYVLPRQAVPPDAPDWSSAPEFSTPWSCHPVNAAYIERFLALADSYDLPVFWLFPPDFPGYQGQLEARGVDRALVKAVEAALQRYPHLSIIDGRHAIYDASLFHDRLHLDDRGATALSYQVGRIVDGHAKSESLGQRWYRLPNYEAPAISVEVEDLEESRLALEQYGSHRGVTR